MLRRLLRIQLHQLPPLQLLLPPPLLQSRPLQLQHLPLQLLLLKLLPQLLLNE
jgi:hypothetical protein